MDLILSPNPANVVYMTMNGLGIEDRSLASIGSGASVTLKHGRASQNVTVHFRDDGECFVNYMEMNAALAKRLKLQASRRYRLQYNAQNKQLTAVPDPVSSARAMLRTANKLPSGSIYIGNALRSILGIPERRGLAITVRQGRVSRKLAMYTPANLLDRGFRLSPSTARVLSLRADAPLVLSFDQRTLTLSVTAAPTDAADKQTGEA